MKLFIALFGLLVLATPAFASAASYAFVNQSGNVSVYEASTANQAIANAPNISLHSGVMLLSSLSDSIVGDNVTGL